MVAIEGTGDANTRYNIDTFSSTESSLEIQIQWSLYVRAVAMLQTLPVDDPLSYYRIAGIYLQIFLVFRSLSTSYVCLYVDGEKLFTASRVWSGRGRTK